MAIDFAKLSAPYFTLYGETVVYTKASGATRSITAVVDRQPRSNLPLAADVVRPRFVVYVRNSVTLGILQTELERSTDTLTFAGDLGAYPNMVAFGSKLADHLLQVLFHLSVNPGW